MSEAQGRDDSRLTCVGKDGVTRQFFWRFELDKFSEDEKWTFRVETEANRGLGRFFELIVLLKDESTVRVDVMHHHDQPEYMAKGIPDALLPVVKRVLDKIVESSPGQGPTADVRRNCKATKVWERLVDNDLARYDKERDVYVLL